MSAIIVNKDNFQEIVMESDRKVLLDFWAPWCGPCQMLLPVIEELAGQVQDVRICKINVDEERELAKQFRVMSIPTLVVMDQGQVVQRSLGYKPKEEVLELLK